MLFPTPHSVEHIRRTGSTKNPIGQRLGVYAAPVSRPVHGWRSKATTEIQSTAMAGRVISEVYLLTPDADWASGDRVRIQGRLYDVVGDPEDVSHGPFPRETGLFPGCRLTLRRVTDGET